MKVGVGDIARRSGVSPATVSRVLNENPDVNEETRQKVLGVIQELGYLPVRGARKGSERRGARTLGLVVADITNPFYNETARVIINRARELGYDVILCNTEDNPDIHRESVDLLVRRKVNGLILASVRRVDPGVTALIRSGFPIIQYNRRLDSNIGNYVVSDNRTGAFRGTEYLIQLGHRNIGFINGPEDCSTSVERLSGFLEALKAYGITPDPTLIRNCGFRSVQAFAVTMEWLQRQSRPTAIFASNDSMALGVLEATKNCGLQVPRDISVMGFDDVDLVSHKMINLTTISQKKVDMGVMVVEKLIEIINKQCEVPVQLVLEPALIVRGTCAPPPADSALGLSKKEPVTVRRE